MRGWRVLALVVLLAVGPRVGAAPEAPREYRFAPGDVIEVTVTPQRGFDRTLTVQPDGMISFPVAGQIGAAGLTLEALGRALREGLNRELVDPVVIVSLREAGKREVGRVSLLGAVRSPGGFEIREGTTLTEILALAGGPAARADLRRVTITSVGGAVRSVDLSDTGQAGRSERRTVLQPGDVVMVPEGAAPTVLVLGEVTKPGSYEIAAQARLLDVVALAGGFSPKADARRVAMARAGVPGTRTLDLQPLLERGDTSNPELNPVLTPGDTVFIPETEQLIYVLGSVTRPGLHAIKPTDRVLDALVAAGGAGGGISKAVLVRRGPDGQPVPRALDLKKIMARGDAVENELLRPGDMLFVPDKKERRSAMESFNLIWPLTGLFTLFRN